MLKRAHLFFTVILLASCARQGAIPNTDKFPPHLTSVTSVNRTQVVASFDEELDTNALLPSTFLITSAHDTAEIRFIAKDPADRLSLVLLTSSLLDETYQISGLVADYKGNASSIRSSFRASTRQDTTPPGILISPVEPVASFPYTFRFEFSEPVDTSKGMRTLTAPAASDELFRSAWSRDLARYEIRTTDTTVKGPPFYIIVLPGICDFSGNVVTTGLAGFIYSDTTLMLRDIRGQVKTQEGKPAPSAIVLFKTEDVFAATITDSAGVFLITLEEREGVTAEAWFDHDGNGLYEEKASFSREPLADSVALITQPVALPVSLDQLIPKTQ
jgi:hypothetical protein